MGLSLFLVAICIFFKNVVVERYYRGDKGRRNVSLRRCGRVYKPIQRWEGVVVGKGKQLLTSLLLHFVSEISNYVRNTKII